MQPPRFFGPTSCCQGRWLLRVAAIALALGLISTAGVTLLGAEENGSPGPGAAPPMCFVGAV